MYLLFEFDCYYPMGGWHDHKGTFKKYKKARKAAAESRADYVQIIEVGTWKVMYER